MMLYIFFKRLTGLFENVLREGAINMLRWGCANLASFDPKMLTPPKKGTAPPKRVYGTFP